MYSFNSFCIIEVLQIGHLSWAGNPTEGSFWLPGLKCKCIFVTAFKICVSIKLYSFCEQEEC